jgi:hypothetical protein
MEKKGRFHLEFLENTVQSFDKPKKSEENFKKISTFISQGKVRSSSERSG